MQSEWDNFGDASPMNGQTWLRYGGEDYAECVEIINAETVGDAGDNVWIITRGTVFFNPMAWDGALEFVCLDTYGPPEYWQVAYAFHAYGGLELDIWGGFEIVQVGRRDSFGDCPDYRRCDGPDVVLHGNASIEKYLAENYLRAA